MPFSPGLHHRHIAACVRLGDCRADDGISAHDTGKIGFLLFFRTKGLDHFCPETARTEALAAPWIDSPEFFCNKGVFKKTEARTAVFLPDECTDKSIFCSASANGQIKFFFLVELLRSVSELTLCEFPCRFDDILLFHCQFHLYPPDNLSITVNRSVIALQIDVATLVLKSYRQGSWAVHQ